MLTKRELYRLGLSRAEAVRYHVAVKAGAEHDAAMNRARTQNSSGRYGARA